ncbi:MAG: choice-of-anchor L domain-containing protein [Polyangiaceae bacterium]
MSARYVRSGSDINNLPTYTPGAEVGITSLFGNNVGPQIGGNMLVLSSGHARDANDPGACGSLSCSNHASGTPVSGYPQPKSGCEISNAINDDIGFEVTLRAPVNATGFKFRFRFYSFEYPEWVCTTYNDQFAAIVTPQPTGSLNGNISFDSQGAPVSVNNALFGDG